MANTIETKSQVDKVIESWSKEFLEKFYAARDMMDESQTLKILEELKEKIPGHYLVEITSYKDVDDKSLEKLADQIRRPPYQRPDLACSAILRWKEVLNEDERLASYIMVTAQPASQEIVVAGGTVKKLPANTWKSTKKFYTILWDFLLNPATRVVRQNESFQNIHPTARLGSQR